MSSNVRLAALGLLTFLASCAPPPVSGLRCEADAECAVGRACVDGTCVERVTVNRDAGAKDASDPGGEDAGEPDVGEPDAGLEDAGLGDAGSDDAGVADAGDEDAGEPDAGEEPSDVCGDGVLAEDEACDDGNLEDRDGCSSACRVWWDEDFPLRARVRLTNPVGPLSNVPVLVAMPMSALMGGSIGTTACFVADDHIHALPYEVDTVDGGNVLVWVRVPLLSSGNSSAIWLYTGYTGSASGPCGTDPADTWSGYHGVWHLDDALADATGRGAWLAPGGSTSAAGRVGRGRHCTETARAMNAPINSHLQLHGDVTIEAWIHRDTPFDEVGNQILIVTEKGDRTRPPNTPESPALNALYSLRVDSVRGPITYWEYDEGIDHAFYPEVPPPILSGRWHHVAVTRDASTKTVTFYLDGQTVGSESYQYDSTHGSLSRLYLCANPNFEDHGFGGSLDEVRVSSDVKSADWIRMSFLSGGRQVATVGALAAD